MMMLSAGGSCFGLRSAALAIGRGGPRAFRRVALFSGSPASGPSTGEETASLIQKLVGENDVVLFMKGTPRAPQCGFSRAVCQLLEMHGVPNVTAVNVLEDERMRSGVKLFTSWPTIPQLFVRGTFVGGCDILLEMNRSGELRKLLLADGIVKEGDDGRPAEE